MRVFPAVLTAVTLAILAACQAAPAPVAFTDDDASAIRSLIQETYAQAMLEGDLETALSIWAEDAVRVPPMGATLRGREAISAAYASMPYRVTALEHTNVDVQGSGDLAFMVCDYSFAAEGEEDSIAETGVSFVVFRRIGGEWKVTANMWRPDTQPVEEVEVQPAE